ncbi:alkaline shock response membrane anchor protein AmaP [Streptomyces desertarenae]|uniref:Alkaline shock response membrane anchor protein AmaP n=1 Tax=Streptomyces desertarenae TaxID=2666184 RepID=A0ABW4PM65_9ACTN
MLTAVNRTLLGLTGLVLLGAGLSVLAGGLDLHRNGGIGLPAQWPWNRPDEVLLARGTPAWWGDAGWWRRPVAIGVPAVVLLLALWWLQAQLRRRPLDKVLVGSGDGYGALLRAPALENAMDTEAEDLPGVERCRTRLGHRRTGPRARIDLVLAPHADPARTLADLRDGPLENARASAGLEVLPAEVRLRAARHRTRRVS